MDEGLDSRFSVYRHTLHESGHFVRNNQHPFDHSLVVQVTGSESGHGLVSTSTGLIPRSGDMSLFVPVVV